MYINVTNEIRDRYESKEDKKWIMVRRAAPFKSSYFSLLHSVVIQICLFPFKKIGWAAKCEFEISNTVDSYKLYKNCGLSLNIYIEISCVFFADHLSSGEDFLGNICSFLKKFTRNFEKFRSVLNYSIMH